MIRKWQVQAAATRDRLAQVPQTGSMGKRGLLQPTRLFNNTDTVFLPGHVIGFDATGALALAIAGTTIVRSCFVSRVTCQIGEEVVFAASGVWPVRVQSDVAEDVGEGDPAYLSATEAGTLTNSRPSGGTQQLVGMFAGTKRTATQNLIPVVLHVDLAGASR